MTNKMILYYSNLICQKIDLHTSEFLKRVDALKAGDYDKVEFIEKMTLEPLMSQIYYLTEKANKLSRKARLNG